LQNIVIDKPYEFVPPVYGTFWARLLGRFLLPHYLRSSHGVDSYELIGAERLRASVEAGHGILRRQRFLLVRPHGHRRAGAEDAPHTWSTRSS
jgi:hypothetical protein